MVKKWQKYLKSLSKRDRLILIEIIKKIISGDHHGLDIKPLTNKKGYYRCRVGQLRILFFIKNGNYFIDQIGSRLDIYK